MERRFISGGLSATDGDCADEVLAHFALLDGVGLGQEPSIAGIQARSCGSFGIYRPLFENNQRSRGRKVVRPGHSVDLSASRGGMVTLRRTDRRLGRRFVLQSYQGRQRSKLNPSCCSLNESRRPVTFPSWA